MLTAIITLTTVVMIALDRCYGDSSNDATVLAVALVTLPVKPLLIAWDAWIDGRQARGYRNW